MSDGVGHAHLRPFVVVSGLVVLLDQLTKWLVSRELGPGGTRESIEIVPGWVSIDYATNDGVAFGMLQGGSSVVWIAVALGLTVGAVFLARTLPGASRPMVVALGLCTGGAIGNLLDRVVRGFVVDFIDVGGWPAFNLADAGLTVGLIMIVALHLLDMDRDAPAS